MAHCANRINLKGALKFWVKGALLPRIFFALIASATLTTWVYSNSKNGDLVYSFLCALVVVTSLYIGSIVNISKLSLKKPSWTDGFYTSLLTYIVFLLIFHPSLILLYGFSFGMFINITYLGAKIGCMKLGCCGIKSIKDRHLFGWKLRPRLQSFEVVTTLSVLVLGGALYYVGYQFSSGFILLAGHGLLRVFSGTYRFPYKSMTNFLHELSGGGIIAVGFLSFLPYFLF